MVCKHIDMKKATLTLIMFLMVLSVFAQTEPRDIKFGYLSYDSVMLSMPEYAEMQTSMQQLRTQYEAEQQRVEDDFNKKYEEFLDGQAAFPKTILQKRQSELQEMLDKNIAFKKQSQQLLSEAESGMLKNLRAIIQQAVNTIGQQRGYAFILNTDKETLTFINPAIGEDITLVVKELLEER